VEQPAVVYLGTMILALLFVLLVTTLATYVRVQVTRVVSSVCQRKSEPFQTDYVIATKGFTITAFQFVLHVITLA